MKLSSPPKSLTRGAHLIGDEQRARDLRELQALLRTDWQDMGRSLEEAGELIASRQYFRELVVDPPIVNQTTVTGVTAITALWDAANLTPLPANTIRAGQIFKVTAFGVMTQAVTANQTATFTPIFGTAVGGTSLGASIAEPLAGVVFTNTNWIAQFYVHFRSTGAGGTAVCSGGVTAQPLVGQAAGSQGATALLGTGNTVATTVNTTIASGLLLAVTPSLTTQSYTTLGVAMESLN